jgi:predicted MFS family arabinose efflux permease
MTTICADQVRTATRGWAASVAMAATVFTVVTAEMLPVGLLTPIGSSLQVSEGTAGLTLTVTGLVSAVAAPVLPLVLGKLDRRIVMVGLMALLGAAGVLAAAAPNFLVLMIARVLFGVSLGGVWLFTIGLARRVVPEHAAGPATSLIFSGIGIASVLGIPAGAYVGELLGWRWAFAAVGVLSAALAVALALYLPSLPASKAVSVGDVAAVLRLKQIRVGLVLVALLVTGHFAAYTYIRPLLEKTAGISPSLIGTMLLAYGVAGVVGNFIAGSARPARALGLIAVGIAAVAVLLPIFGTTLVGALVLLVFWGLAHGGVSVSTQAWGHAAAPDAPEASSAVLVGVYNGSIALGAFTGGQFADHLGITTVTWLPALLATAALIVVVRARRR